MPRTGGVNLNTVPKSVLLSSPRVAPYKAPRIWVFVDEFPMTPSGKIQKFVLRAQARELVTT